MALRAGGPAFTVRVGGDAGDGVFLAACEPAAMCGVG